MTVALLSVRPEQAADWAAALRHWSDRLAVSFSLHVDPAAVAPEAVDALIAAPNGAIADFAPYRGTKLIHSLWAGVEAFLASPGFPVGPPLCRMVEPSMTAGMTDYICGHVLRHHLDIDRSIRDSAAARWRPAPPPVSTDRKVGLLGLGALGADAARMLARLRFDVAGWSRSAKSIPGVACYRGAEGLDAVLSRSEILATVLPATAETRHILNRKTLARLPKGAVIVNPGRGDLIDEVALLDALETGHIAYATLDVFAAEPLPGEHPFWRRKDVTVTPHIASETRISGGALLIVEQIGRLQRGEPLLHIVDVQAGY